MASYTKHSIKQIKEAKTLFTKDDKSYDVHNKDGLPVANATYGVQSMANSLLLFWNGNSKAFSIKLCLTILENKFKTDSYIV